MDTQSCSNNRRAVSCALLLLTSTLCVVSGFGVGHNGAFALPKTGSVPSSSALFLKRGGRPRGPLRTIEVKPTMNQEIAHAQLRVVTPSDEGKDEPLGIMTKSEALAKAKEMGNLDLILINENSDPPVCKIVDYSKWRYMKEKKAKELKKNAKAVEVKEVKMSYKIDVHDYGVRMKAAAKFLKQGNRVKCTVMFKGREIQHEKLGFDLLHRLADELGDLCLMEGKPKKEGRTLFCFVMPKPEVVKAINDAKRNEEKQKKKLKEESKKLMDEKMATTALAAEEGDKLAAKAEEIRLEEAAGGVDDDEDEGDLDELLGGLFN